MRRPTGRLVGAILALSLALSSAVGAAGTAAAVGVATRATDTEASGVRPPSGEPAVKLPRPARGATALRLVGDQLDEVAQLNDLRPAELVALLRSDASVWLSSEGLAFYKDAAQRPTERFGTSEAAAYPLDETLELHSNPGSDHTIFLDFDGATVAGTAWNANFPTMPTAHPAWDPSDDGPSFSDAELTAIQTVWASVAEDYAPFDVDVTTADPGPAAIARASNADQVYGSHALISPSGAWDTICERMCGGVAFLGVTSSALPGGSTGYGYVQPAWVFPQGTTDAAKSIAEAVSHEVGHNMGLDHDDHLLDGYYQGHASWAPIMGAGYYRPITQWSQGSYAGAGNTEPDLAILEAVLGVRTDESTDTIAGAAALPSGTAYVTSPDDVDTYLLGTCSGAVTIDADPPAELANLDIGLTLLDATGAPVATEDPPSARVSASVASGMSASLTRTLGIGRYYVQVDGVGSGPWSTGYDDYGSLGAYTMAVTGSCDDVAPPESPGPVVTTTTTLAAAVEGRTVTLTAVVGSEAGTPAGAVTFTQDGAAIGGGVTLVAGAAVRQVSDVAAGAHGFTATFVPADPTAYAASASAERSVTVVPTATTTLLTGRVSGSTITLDTQVTAAGGGAPSGRVLIFDGTKQVGASVLGAGRATLLVTGVSVGKHGYTAHFEPAGADHAGSRSGTLTLSVAAMASRITLKAPSTVKRGGRPTVTVKVTRGSAAATGKVVLRYGPKSVKLTLRNGSASHRLPKVRRGTVKLVAAYPGDRTTKASSARRSITVR